MALLAFQRDTRFWHADGTCTTCGQHWRDQSYCHCTDCHQLGRTLPASPGNQHSCHRCAKGWRGFAPMHCMKCHETFTGLTAFDLHRKGSPRRCRPPADVGLVDAGRQFPCWGQPGAGDWWE